MELYIDGHLADTGRETAASVSISVSLASLTSLDESRMIECKGIRVPVTARNRELTGNAEQSGRIRMFNQEIHTGRIELHGCVVMEGDLCLERAEMDETGSGWYLFRIVGTRRTWVEKASADMFREIPLAFEERLSGTTISSSWTWNKPVRFLPVQRRESEGVGIHDPAKPVRLLSFEDYHPFLHVRTLMETVIGQSGYAIRSEFMQGEFFDSLYITGNYHATEVDLLRNRMDFEAGRFTEREAVTDDMGQIYADPMIPGNSLGNIIETADPEEVVGGERLEGVFSTNGCIRKMNGGLAFVVKQEAMVSFEYDLNYKTDYYMTSRDELSGVDRMNLQDGVWRHNPIRNRYPDRRGELSSEMNYRVVVFGYLAGQQYQLKYDEVTDPAADLSDLKPGQYRTVTAGTFSTRSASVNVISAYRVTNPRLWSRVNSSGSYMLYDRDWALYDGYVQERGRVEVNVTVRTVPKLLKPGNHYFNHIVFAGLETGLKMTLGKSVRLRPVFFPFPNSGSLLVFEDLAGHRVRQIKLLEAVQHLFNLCFYTDTAEKVVYIEPRDIFFRNDVVVDWRDRQERGKPVEAEEMGLDLNRTQVWRYLDGDLAVARWEQSNHEVLGDWSTVLQNRFAPNKEELRVSPMCTPAVIATEGYPDAPDAGLLRIIANDRKGARADGNLNFLPKIVQYRGMKALPKGQLWGWPGNGNTYPSVGFCQEGEMSLCFEDRNGMEGLHRFYDRDIRTWNQGRRVTLWLNLEPRDVEPFIVPDNRMRDFRARFLLEVDGEDGYYRLESIGGYSPSGGPARCVFVREV